MAGVNQNLGTTPTCHPGAFFSQANHRPGACVWPGRAGMVQSGWKDTLGTLQTSKSGLENMQRSFLFCSANPARSMRWDAEEQGMGMSLEHPAELSSPLLFPTTLPPWVLCPHPNLA